MAMLFFQRLVLLSNLRGVNAEIAETIESICSI